MKILCSIQLIHLLKDHQCCLKKYNLLITTILGVSCVTLESKRFSLIIAKNRMSPKQTDPTLKSNPLETSPRIQMTQKHYGKLLTLCLTRDPNLTSK